MQVFSTITETKNCLLNLKKQGKKIGFVPTMGALHPGHISLLQRAKNENDIAVASIFVNPLQFNDKKDLEKYPRTLKNDSEMLESAACDVLFAPSAEEMYPSSPPSGQPKIASEALEGALDLGILDKVMEGLHRPGHFQGVCVVVKKLFDIIKPDKAYFGEKD
ncbi:MAG: pantoate--beta-alanine ligase, partial [Phycisphaeraceae bacterium]|nr:pantoate--beta-alanine ligase [Phycisphaeraceae bacterium]